MEQCLAEQPIFFHVIRPIGFAPVNLSLSLSFCSFAQVQRLGSYHKGERQHHDYRCAMFCSTSHGDTGSSGALKGQHFHKKHLPNV
eukprot:1949723-Amphidinium_carterae.1